MVSQRRIVNETILPYLSEYRIGRIAMEASNQVAPLYRELSPTGLWIGGCMGESLIGFRVEVLVLALGLLGCQPKQRLS
jgi:hypothetical protein